MTFQVGEPVLLHKLIGEDLDPPIKVLVTDSGLSQRRSSFLYSYEVEIPRVVAVETGRVVDNLRVWAMEDWLSPYTYEIEEIPDTPWD